MTEEALTQTQEDEALAAEYALGLLTDEQRQAADQRIAAEADFAQAVLLWQERLAVLADELTPVMTPARTMMNIHRRLGHLSEPLSDVPEIRGTARSRRSGRESSWVRWLVLVIALAVAIFVILRITGGPDYTAQLVSDPAGLQVEARLDGREMDIDIEQGSAAEGRDLELWWIGGPDQVPVSLGVLPRDGDLAITLPEGLVPGDGVQLALTDEPQGGAPGGVATGDIIAVGPLSDD